MYDGPDLSELVRLVLPEFHFSSFEACYPVDPKAWVELGWDRAWSVGGQNPGTALFQVPTTATGYTEDQVVAGSHHPGGALLTTGGGGPSDLGSYTSEPIDQSWFLDMGGWTPEGSDGVCGQTQGSLDRDAQFAQALTSALNPAMAPQSAPESSEHGADVQGPMPTMYVELDWAGIMPRMDAANGTGDFASPPGTPVGEHVARTDFDNYIVLTIYLFYPFTDTSLPSGRSTGGMDARNREGQWEAVSLFIQGVADVSQMDANGRPLFTFPPLGPNSVLQGQAPAFAAYSQGSLPTAPVRSDARPLTDQPNFPSDQFPVQWGGSVHHGPFGSTAVEPGGLKVFVSAGTHKNLFTSNEVFTTTTGSPDATDAAAGGILGSVGGAVAGGCWATGPAAVVACAIGLILLALGALFTALSVANEPTITTDTEEPAGPSADLTGSDGAKVWTIDGTTPGIRLINRFEGPTSTEDGQDVRPPAWWNYPGKWGVQVLPSLSSSWTSGTRRVDTFGRSWAYWNMVTLANTCDRFGLTH